MIAPTISAGMLTTSPTRMQATPIAKPMGQRLGAGTCGVSGCSSLTRRLRASALDSTLPPCSLSTPNPPATAAAILHGSVPGRRGQPELGPPGVDALLHLGGHLDLRRPLARALVGPLRRRVEADLAAEGREHRGVVELVDRAVGEDDVALRVDVRADAEEDVLVVVDVHVLVDDDHGLREREEP